MFSWVLDYIKGWGYTITTTVLKLFAGKPNAIKISNALLINFSYNGREQHVWVPYDSRAIRHMTDKQVYLECQEGFMKEITQMPGVPYLVSPYQLGGVGAKVFSKEDPSEQHTVNCDEVIVV